MRSFLRFTRLPLLALPLLVAAWSGPAPAQPGAAPSTADTRRKVAILLFPNVEIIDYTGPYELFGCANYDVYTVAATTDPLTTSMGMTVVPRYDFAAAPTPDLLVVPGGGVWSAAHDSTVLRYVSATAARARHVMSVCNGAVILASAGLLDGLTATTTYGGVIPLHRNFPKVRVVGDRRWVDNGKIVTTGGLSAGMDGALHLVAVMDGEREAREVALQEEYNWQPEGGYVRPSLADRMIPRMNLAQLPASVGTWDIVSSKGGADRWETVLRGGSQLGADSLLDRIGALYEKNLDWVPVGSGAASGASSGASSGTAREWTVPGLGGERWRGRVEVDRVAAAENQFTVKLAVARAR